MSTPPEHLRETAQMMREKARGVAFLAAPQEGRFLDAVADVLDAQAYGMEELDFYGDPSPKSPAALVVSLAHVWRGDA